MIYRLYSTLALSCILTTPFGQGQQVSSVPDQKVVQATANRALEAFGLKNSSATIEPSASNPSNVFVYFKESNMLVNHVRNLVVYASNEVLQSEIRNRASGLPTIKRSDAKWAELGQQLAKKLWPAAKLTLKKATRYPEEARNRITGQGSPRSNSINLEYRGNTGTWRIRADVVFDQVTGKVAVVRLGDEPKPR